MKRKRPSLRFTPVTISSVKETAFAMKQRLLCVLILLCLLVIPSVLSESSLTAEPLIGIFQISDETSLGYTSDTAFDKSDLKAGTYASFVFRLTNNSSKTIEINSAYARIDDGNKLGWGAFSLAPSYYTNCHIFYSNMSKVTAGTHKVDLYINGQKTASAYFTLKDGKVSSAAPKGSDSPKNQSASKNPSASKNFTPTNRSPYLACEPIFPNTKGFTEYAVDFIVENQPIGTYLCLCNWDMDLSYTRQKYASVYRAYNGVAAYGGVQILQDGTHAAIMSVWHTYCKDKKGNVTTIEPKITYVAEPIKTGSFGGEGTGIQCIVQYDWKANTPYRFLLQQHEDEKTGNCLMEMWICDLSTMVWSRLIQYDLGIQKTYINRAVTFLENYIVESAAEYRDARFSNFRARNSRTGKWVSATQAKMWQDFDYPGSYTYGSDDSSFFCRTTGLPGIWSKPRQYATFKVRKVESGSPY